MGWGGVPPPKGGVLAQKQAKTAKNSQFLFKIGTNLNKILDIHVIEDFIKALQCATLILLVCWMCAMQWSKDPNKRLQYSDLGPNRPKSGIFWAKTQKIPLYQIWAKSGPKMATPPL